MQQSNKIEGCTSEYMSNCAGPLPFLASLPRVNLDYAGDPTPEMEAPIMTRVRLILDIFGQTLGTLWAHKLRTILTMFDIACDVGTLLLLVGLREGLRSGNRNQLDTPGEYVMVI